MCSINTDWEDGEEARRGGQGCRDSKTVVGLGREDGRKRQKEGCGCQGQMKVESKKQEMRGVVGWGHRACRGGQLTSSPGSS